MIELYYALTKWFCQRDQSAHHWKITAENCKCIYIMYVLRPNIEA